MKSPTVTKIGPGVFRRRGALPRPPDRAQVVDELPPVYGESPIRELVLAMFRDARRRR